MGRKNQQRCLILVFNIFGSAASIVQTKKHLGGQQTCSYCIALRWGHMNFMINAWRGERVLAVFLAICQICRLQYYYTNIGTEREPLIGHFSNLILGSEYPWEGLNQKIEQSKVASTNLQGFDHGPIDDCVSASIVCSKLLGLNSISIVVAPLVYPSHN